jgi:hypothetical protein
MVRGLRHEQSGAAPSFAVLTSAKGRNRVSITFWPVANKTPIARESALDPADAVRRGEQSS